MQGAWPRRCQTGGRLILRGKVRSKGKTIAGEKVGVVKRVLSEQEVGELIRWRPNFTRLVEDVLTMYLWMCTRGSDICGMSGAEVTLEGDQWWWTIPKARTKNARHANATEHRVPLLGRALAVVQRRKALYGDGYLFPAKGAVGTAGGAEAHPGRGFHVSALQ